MFLYIDGTTGGMVLQVLLGSLVGSFVVLKLGVKNLFSWLSHRPSSDPADSRDGAGVSENIDSP